MTEYQPVTNCKYCGKLLESKAKTRQYCSSRCKEAARLARLELIQGTCKGCGKPITYKLIKGKPSRQYCSASCQLRHTVPTKILTCVDCGKQFEFVGRTTKLRCDACWRAHRAELARDQQALRLAKKQADGQTVHTDNSCVSTYRKRIITGNDKCEICGYDKNAYALVVHHMDLDHLNNTRDNLCVLCANCHAILHKMYLKKSKLDTRSAQDLFNEFKQAEVKSRNEAGTPCEGQSEPKADSNDSQGQRIPAGPAKDISRHEAATASDS